MNIDPQPQNGGCLWLLLIPLMFVFAFFSPPTPVTDVPLIPVTPTPVMDEPVFISPYVIESASAIVRESFPAQVSIAVTGYAPDGCDFPMQIEQRRSGNAIQIDIYRIVPLAAMCPAMIVPFERTIDLGTLEPGSYTVTINDFVIQFTV